MSAVGVDLPAGGNTVLEVDGRAVRRVVVSLGWRLPAGAPFEVDAQMALLGSDGRVAAPEDLVPLAALAAGGPPGPGGPGGPGGRGSPGGPGGLGASEGPGGSGEGAGDVEQVVVDLDAVPAAVARLSFSAAIHAAAARGQTFGQVSGAVVRVADADGREIARHVLALPGRETAVVLGELYRHRGGWKFRAVGQGYTDGLAAVARDVGAL